ncbi:MAG TPA: SH3 domain-containing protein [Devosia sp.]|uniref:SH3 domain-containing protein n=1 Tax=Devosia sp. TaxID=1871048 RepID=UPI002DDD3BB5|nr:SH3 domain-containing protein [Devosia sp.]HEV2517323.1 SH3 domain-containing protein [Devosia sp.]
MKTLFLFGSLMLAGVIAGSAPAAEAISGANIRSGPGVNYPVVGKLAQGDNVTVSACAEAGWCRISGGWVSANLLADNGNPADYYNAPGGRAAAADRDDRGDSGDDGYPRLIGRASDLGFSRRGGRLFDLFAPRDDGGELVCLVTFNRRADVKAGRDRDVASAELLWMRDAQRYDGPNDRNAIYDYGSDRQTAETCRRLEGED